MYYDHSLQLDQATIYNNGTSTLTIWCDASQVICKAKIFLLSIYKIKILGLQGVEF